MSTAAEDTKPSEKGLHDREAQQYIVKVEEVDLSAYDFTPEENRAIVRKFDWHVSWIHSLGAMPY